MDERRGLRPGWAGRLLVGIGIAMVGGRAEADLIYLRGGAVQVPTATAEGDRIILLLPDGKLELRREDIVKRVPGFCPSVEWESRRREALGAGFAARHAAVWWAIENGLTTEVIPEVRELRRLDPGHAPTARMAGVLDRLDRPCADPDISAFREALGIEASVARGPHVLLLHQHSEAEAAERIAILERVILGFHLSFAAQGVELRVPRHRLISAWFADREDYLAFLHRQGADAFATTGGYFHPTWGAVVAFDARSEEAQRAARAELASRRDTLRQDSDLLEQMLPGGRVRLRLGEGPLRSFGRADGREWLDRMERELACRTALLDLNWRTIDLGLAAHEMVHQLSWDSGLAPRHDAFPYWLHEGLAAQFELIRGGRWAGIGRANDLRLPDWRGQQPPVKLERLIRDVGFGRGYRRDLYASAWALVYYLRARRPSEFLAFLDLLRNPPAVPDSDEDAASHPADEPRGERVYQAFCRTFGLDLDALDRDWHGFMAGVQTPMERNAPGSDSTPRTRPDQPRNPPDHAATAADPEAARRKPFR